jgi:hypothetical protein
MAAPHSPSAERPSSWTRSKQLQISASARSHNIERIGNDRISRLQPFQVCHSAWDPLAERRISLLK